MAFAVALASVFLLMTGPSVIDGKYVEGVVGTTKDMQFLARFVFEPDQLGQLWYEFKYPADYCCYQMLLFNDDDSQWPYVRENEDKLTCKEKKDQIPSNYNGKVTLNTPYNCVNKTENGMQMLVCSGTRHFTTERPRWWFVNVANCNHQSPTEGIYLQYKLNMTNGLHPLDKNFSADERYTLQTSIAFAVLYFLMVLTGMYYKYQLSKRRLLHSTYQLFFTSLCLQLAALIFIIVALASFAGDGVEMPALKTIGHVISSIGDVVFVLALMLVAKGYTITRGRISTTGSVKLAVFICLYALTFVFLYAYEQMAFDPRDVMFIYDSPAGLGLVILRCIGIVWLYYCVFFTMKKFRDKIKFYVLFLLFFAVWFAAEPIMIMVANVYIPKYMRAKIVNGVYWAMMFLGHMIFLVLTRPDRTNEYFPYHIKTNQVAAMIIEEEDTSSDFHNPFIGHPLTRSLTDIFLNAEMPKDPESKSAQDVGSKPEPQAPKSGPNYSIFCIEKSQPAVMVVENEKQSQNKIKTASSHHLPYHKSSGAVEPARIFTVSQSIKDIQKQESTDSDFVEIPLDDLTITDY